ncbi:MAG: hypothetical protein WCK90_00535 [archaeon]
MKDTSIIFQGPNVRLIRAGLKTQTRRVIDPQPQTAQMISETTASLCYPAMVWLQCKYGVPGDNMWVREAWRVGIVYDGLMPSELKKCNNESSRLAVDYLADGPSIWSVEDRGKVRSSIYMPRWASRIDLEIEKIRVERVQSISHDDAIAEGCFGQGWKVSDTRTPVVYPADEYAQLWESINGNGSWVANPWVWAVTFKIKEKELAN